MAKGSSYPGLLAVLNVILLVASTVLVFLGTALITFYHLDKLDFISPYFSVTPYIVVGLGVVSFLLALFGIVVGCSESRPLLVLFAFAMIVVFVTQLAGIFTAMELRGVINHGDQLSSNVVNEVNDYGENPSTRHRWDTLQKEFHCCGGVNFNTGYTAYRLSDIGRKHNAVPDSCCHKPDEKCGHDIFEMNTNDITQKIYTHGCLDVIKSKLEGQVVPMLEGYAAVGTVLALIQLLTIVFACSYSAQISRRSKMDEIYADARSLGRTSTYRGEHLSTGSLPITPRADRIRRPQPPPQGYVNANMSSVFASDEMHMKYAESETDMGEREV